MQNSTHAASQTNLVQTSTSDYVPTPTYMPTHSPTYYTLELHTFCLTQPSILIICHNQYHLLIMIFTAHLFIMEECHITQRSVKIMDHHRFQTTPILHVPMYIIRTIMWVVKHDSILTEPANNCHTMPIRKSLW